MTIAAGFQCRDGVVLCADTQMTAAIKFSQSKIRMFNKLKSHPAFVYAGDRDFSLMAIQMIAEAILKAESRKGTLESAIRTEVIEIHHKYHGLSTQERPFDLLVLVALEHDKKRRLLLISGPTVSRVEQAECIGAGSILGGYIADTMFDKWMTVSQAACMAAYLLFLTKKYVPYCGNDSQILILQNGHGYKQFPEGPISIEEMEGDFRSLQSNLKKVLIGLVDFELTNDNYATFLGDFTKTASGVRTKRSEQINRYIESSIRWQEEEGQRYAEETERDESET